jgi:hypothetical protein
VDYGDMLRNADRYRDLDVGEYCDPILLPLLSTESMELVADGVQYTRIQKTLRITNYNPAREYLNVCVGGDSTHANCSVCGKCCRTLMTLKSAGIVDQFSHLFDVQKYTKRAELPYTATQVLQKNKDPFARGNIELARANEVKLPGAVASVIITTWYSLKNHVLRNLFRIGKIVLPENIRKSIKGRLSGTSMSEPS